MSAKILLVEDNPHYLAINREALAMNGYRVVEAETISRGKELFEQENPDLIILDIMLPDGDGLEMCEELRRGSQVPILFLSALGKDEEILAGFKAGGDDYLPKPYDLDVLIARTDALLRRFQHVPKIVTKGAITLYLNSNRAHVNGVDIGLSEKIEFSLLNIFVQEENKILSMEYLCEEVWRQPMLGNDGAIRKAISAVRGKLEGSGYTITPEYGKGYRFEAVK